MREIAVFTIASKNYLSYARVLMDSIKTFHRDLVDEYLLLADEVAGEFDAEKEDFNVIEARELGIPDFEKMAFKYDIIEFNTAVKPFFIKHLFDKGYRKVIYFDPDIMLFNKLDLLFDLLDSYSIVLTPHMTEPLPPEDTQKPSEQQLLVGGTYNLGFIALSWSEETERFCKWWCRKCSQACFSELESGLFVDQKWINLVPGFFESVYIMRHRGFNMAYWNLHERKLEGNLINGKDPLIFFHFSGVSVGDLNGISRHQNRFTLEMRQDLREMFDLYRDRLVVADFTRTSSWSYRYGTFDDGTPIPCSARRLYAIVEEVFPNPFSTSKGSFYDLLKRRRLIGSFCSSTSGVKETVDLAIISKKMKVRLINSSFKTLSKIIGMERYHQFLQYLHHISVLRNQDFLLK